MFGSQALETAIGLALMFFILATASSAITESISRIFQKRASDLESTILEMLTRPAPDGEERAARDARLQEGAAFFGLFKATSIWQAAEAASGRTLLLRRKVGNSYLSAKSFADAVHEVVASDAAQALMDSVPSLKKRLTALQAEATRGVLDVKAGLESWFDETMSRAQGAYKRWASLVLFVVGLLLAVAGNASTTDVARDLWQDSAVRAAVTEAAGNVGEDQDDLTSVAKTTEELTALHLPVGWDAAGTDDTKADNPVDFVRDSTPEVVVVTILGWLLTAILIMLGGPFWFDLLSRLVSLRSSGSKPPPAVEDEASATNDAAGTPRSATATAAAQAELTPLRVALGVTPAGDPTPPEPPT